MDYFDHNWMGDQATIEGLYEVTPNMIFPSWVDAELAFVLGCSSELQVLLSAEGPKYFTRVRSTEELPLPQGCATYSEADAVAICGVWMR